MFDQRTLDGHTIKAQFVAEEEYKRAQTGEWVAKHRCRGTGSGVELHAGAAGCHWRRRKQAFASEQQLAPSYTALPTMQCPSLPRTPGSPCRALPAVPYLPCPACSGVAGIPLPGLYTVAPIVCGITGLSALNPQLAALVATNPGAQDVEMQRGLAGWECVPSRMSSAALVDTPALRWVGCACSVLAGCRCAEPSGVAWQW